ncbi:putative lipid carrier protein YhbT [Natronospira proteinivora]|uniref:Ubiquinone biosynthesis accessory factor UbiT n=1 Tax=Natronospira proteinivora TaxID=1807133 RepID=A0ABT1G7A8_9GAMM|nr:SCP2 sterol-binding domain-containing protein [Natronospira proteinivora]MCP1727184.1 putative lipid carrier protein YhbT [Natronospira proteinivora]
MFMQSFPQLLRLPVQYTPIRCQALIMEPLLQNVLAESIEDGDLDFLRGEVVEVAISDIGLHWFLTLENDRIKLLGRGRPAVTVTGGVREFLLLASRREDPDTLFFERRLTVEGDTEMGLLVKNLLDSIELEELPLPLRRAVAFGAAWVS